MKRIAPRLALFLLLGAIFNVALAWGFAIWHRSIMSFYFSYTYANPYSGWGQFPGRLASTEELEQLAHDGCDLHLSTDQAVYRVGCEEGRLLGFHSKAFSESLREKTDDPLLIIEGQRPLVARVCTGWPFPCLQCKYIASRPGTSGPQWTIQGGLVVSGNLGSQAPSRAVTLPIRPLLPDFGANAVFYAATLWLLFAFPLALRRRRRIKRGLCRECGYDLRGGNHAACPECGRAVKQ